jgi:pimeloyl-ACP methyl ester carboxylesterase
MRFRSITGALLGVVMILTSGCVTSKVARMITAAPNVQHVPAIVRNKKYAQEYDSLYSSAWRVKVGPPAAEISVATIEPGDYAFHYELVFKDLPNGRKSVSSKHDWKVPEPRPPQAANPKGTIVLLHGYYETKEDMVHWGLRLAEAGYRVVLLDFRGHGRSSGPWIGYGSFEVHDLRQVLDDLQAKGLAGEKIGVLGISYGASMGLLWAAQDQRVAAVVALEPFSNARQMPKELGRAIMPKLAGLLTDADFDRATAKAAKLGGFSWKDGDVQAAVERLTVPVLYIHGGDDTWISPDHSRKLYDHTPGLRWIGIVDHDNHILLAMRLAPIDVEVLARFAEWLPLSAGAK